MERTEQILVAATLIQVLVVGAWIGADPARPVSWTPPSEPPRASNHLEIAGSGTNVEPTRVVARMFEASDPNVTVRVHESIGSTGGILAAADGAVDLGIVSRPLRASERGRVNRIPWVDVPTCLVTRQGAGPERLTRADLIRWIDGERGPVLLREPGDSGTAAAEAAIDGLREAIGRATHWRVLSTDRDMREALLSSPGAIGLFDLGTLRLLELPLRVVPIDGDPCPAARSLAFVHRDLSPLAKRFLAFADSSPVKARLRKAGYR